MAIEQELAIEQEYIRTHPRSMRLFNQQQELMPGGVTHTSRFFEPFPLFIESLRGSRKRDVDGHDYIDYWMGHGANLLGHGHPDVMEAISRQIGLGLHAGGESELAIEWASLICTMVPSAERVRFCAAGGEATQMAVRLARAYTGKDRLVKFAYHYHGWHDAVAVGVLPPLDQAWSSGIPAAVSDATTVLPFNDRAVLEDFLDEHNDVAGVIIEPAGGFNDTIPVDPEFLVAVRDLTRARGVVLIFDEVVTGFRYATGGAQQYFQVTPDVTALGKVMGGGLPAGAVVGRADIMELLAPRGQRDQGRPYIPHHGTWNSAPLAAAAGVATLRLIADGAAIEAARHKADALRAGLNDVFARQGIAGIAYGRSSIWKTFLGEPPALLSGDYSNSAEDARRLRAGWGALARPFRQSMILNGVDTMNTNGFMSAVHTDGDIDTTVTAFQRTLERLKVQKLL